MTVERDMGVMNSSNYFFYDYMCDILCGNNLSKHEGHLLKSAKSIPLCMIQPYNSTECGLFPSFAFNVTSVVLASHAILLYRESDHY